MSIFIRAANPVWYFVDNVGLSLNDQYYISFLTNTFPYLPQSVFMDVNGTIPWPNPLEFFPNGTLPSNLYFDQNLIYRLEIRQGPTQSDPLIYEINNFQPGQGGITPNNLDIVTASNQITNPQFAEVFFTNDYVITAAGTYNIAPGWNLIITGSGGTTTVTQLVLSGSDSAGSPIIVGNPPFALRINSNGWTTVTLEQRFNNNGALWQNGAVAGVILARANGSSETISMIYAESDSGRSKELFTHLFTTANFQFFGGAKNVDNNPVASNSDLSTVAYTNIDLILPPNGSVDISNIQITGQTVPLPASFDPTTDLPQYDQETNERNIDHQFHVYQESLLNQPKTNLLTGWNFSINPWQFYSTTHGAVAANEYTADQTIIVQQAYVASAAGNNVSVSQSGVSNNRAYDVAPLTATNKFALIQYIDAATIKQYWGKILSSMAHIAFSSPTHSTVCRVKMRLIYRSGAPFLPPTISQTEPISSWSNTAGSDPVFSANWTQIIPQNDPIYTLDSTYQSLSFNKFVLPTCLDDSMTLGIVIYTLDNMNPAATSDSMLFQDISLVNNDFAIKASTETFDESLRKCQYYYEKSYQVGTLPATVTALGQQQSATFVRTNAGVTSDLHIQSFLNNFKEVKRAIPRMTFYAPGIVTSDRIAVSIFQDGTGVAGTNFTASTTWTNTVSANGFQMLSKDTSSISVQWVNVAASIGDEGIINYHYVADARLGI